MNKKELIFLFTFLIFTSGVNAVSFDLNATAIDYKIEINEVAKFNLEIKNKLAKQQTFRVYSLDYPTWDISTKPIINPILVDVAPNSSSSIELMVKPLDVKNIIRGQHFVQVSVRSKTTNEALIIPLKISVLSRDYLIEGYVPTVVANIKAPDKIDPREEIPFKVTLNNQNIINYSGLTLTIKSETPGFDDTKELPLGPKEQETLSFIKNIDPLTEPGRIQFEVSVKQTEGERTILSPLVVPIEVKEYSDQNKEKVKKEFLKTEREVTFNSNNDDYSGQIKVESSFFKSIFSSTYPRAQILKDGPKRYFVWDVVLDDQKSMTVKVTENYRFLFILIILAVILVFAYFNYRSPLMISKQVKEVAKKDGGVFSLKVILNIKNRSNQKIDDIEVKENVPKIIEMEKDMSIGTLKPDKILKHTDYGHIVKWHIRDLDVGEERILSYKVRSKLPILGGFSLPSTKAFFKYMGKKRDTNSNRVNVTS